jgi:hypothetical protein
VPGGNRDSSKTRVQPVFDALWSKGRDWLPQLLSLPNVCGKHSAIQSGNLTLLEGYWEPHEKCLKPPVSLLSWLIRNPDRLVKNDFNSEHRKRLANGDPETVDSALTLLRSEDVSRAWYIFEGPTCPDAYLVAGDALVVIEGKRTERSATVDTSWLHGRHQIWRHLDAAWEIRGKRAVYGFFIVESENPDGSVPEAWQRVTQECLHTDALASSFPHRSASEVQGISRCFLGATTWQRVCGQFQIDFCTLPQSVAR